MSLQEEINEARLKIHTDSYPMSIGELASLYEDDEIDIHPEFQRVFRWDETQKSRLIESIFLGIPLPSIFVSQREDGVWDVVDGLQRISTILSFMGKLKTDNSSSEVYFLKTEKTRYLPSIEGKTWQDIGPELQRLFKREKIDLKIIKRESTPEAKLELFQRLNTGGSSLSDQEVRNCLLLMINPNAFTFIQRLSAEPTFLQTMPISERKSEQAYYQEYVIRYFIQQHADMDLRAKHTNIGSYFDDETVRIFTLDNRFNYDLEEEIFKDTFKVINTALGEDAFKKFNVDEKKYKGPVSTTIFEILSTAVANCIRKKIPIDINKITVASKRITELMQKKIPDKTRPIDKMDLTIEIAKTLFTHDKN